MHCHGRHGFIFRVLALQRSEIGRKYGIARPVLRTTDFLIAREFIERNGGAALLPVGRPGVRSKVREIPGSPRLRCSVYAAWHKKNPQQALIDEVFRESAAQSLHA
jgi:DNA-binding transcriptional LysR family regulator